MTMRPRLTLRQRMLLVVLLPAMLLVGVTATLFLVRGNQAADDALSERALAIARFLAPAAEYGVITGNRNALLNLAQAVLEQRDVTAVSIHDQDGETLVASGFARLGFESWPMQLPDHTALMAREHDRLAVAAPVRLAPFPVDDFQHSRPDTPDPDVDATIGWVWVELDTRGLYAHKRELLLTTLALVFIGLSLTTLLALRLARSVVQPVSRLVDAVERVSRGDLRVRLGESAASDELRALERGFDDMSRSIAEAHETLQARVDEATAQLAHQATHDPLTSLPNRRAFEQALEKAVAASRRAQDHGALCFIDLDRFKVVNDTCGHAAGDQLLREIASLLRERVREQDLICRIGGDEFALILRACKTDEAVTVAGHLREAIAEFEFRHDGHLFSVGASVGLVPLDGEIDSASDVLIAADMACYTAKTSGRNQIVVYRHDPDRGRRITDPHPAPPPPTDPASGAGTDGNETGDRR